ncbi:MAG: stage IV sporulation protein A [Clostridia bacterium]|nr:stage IV sporulation protein A [Clostridia bacterium]MBR6744713.1 stage IV sporulation protein A [Clostridia bacterium]
MATNNIYSDIATRTGGDIYIGVVGPVRTGKSTFIKRFMETLVIPNIRNDYDRKRAQDEMPQSAAGKTVMTTEPKFIPDEAVEITLDGGAALSVKMIDCVGYIVPEALGNFEGDKPRMVLTPWSDESMPFDQAAEIGTRKVIRDHSTIGVLMTCDGSFGELSRENYVESEARIAAELHEIHKPFVIVLNSAHPESGEAVTLALSLEEKYHAPVALVNCLELDKNDIRHILELVLLEFPVTEISVELPDFMNALDRSHPIYRSVHETISACASEITKTGDIAKSFAKASENTYVKDVRISRIDLGSGRATVTMELADGLFYGLIGELTGFSIEDDEALLKLLLELSDVKKQYDKVKQALDDVNTSGYGIVVPDIYDMKLEEPQMVKQTGGYGVKLHASAPSIHMIKADIEAEVSPIVGTEQQSEELVNFLLREFETDPRKIWDTNMFGKSLYELINEGLHNKLAHIPDDARAKLSETLSRIINEGSGGLICIIL